jgi:hypothetical protein
MPTNTELETMAVNLENAALDCEAQAVNLENVKQACLAEAKLLRADAGVVRGWKIVAPPAVVLEFFGVPTNPVKPGDNALIGVKIKSGTPSTVRLLLTMGNGVGWTNSLIPSNDSVYAAQDEIKKLFFPWTFPNVDGPVTLIAEALDGTGAVIARVTASAFSIAGTVVTPPPVVITPPSSRPDWIARLNALCEWAKAGSRVMWTRADAPATVAQIIAQQFGVVVAGWVERFSVSEWAQISKSGAYRAVYINLVRVDANSPLRIGAGGGYWGTTNAGDLHNPAMYESVLKPQIEKAQALCGPEFIINFDDFESGYLLQKGALTDANLEDIANVFKRVKTDFPGVGIMPNMDGNTIVRLLNGNSHGLLGGTNPLIDMPHVEYPFWQVMDSPSPRGSGWSRQEEQCAGLRELRKRKLPGAAMDYANSDANAITAQTAYRDIGVMSAINTSGVSKKRLI